MGFIDLLMVSRSQGLMQDDAALILQCEHWLEAADPKHRYGTNLRPYFDEWLRQQRDNSVPEHTSTRPKKKHVHYKDGPETAEAMHTPASTRAAPAAAEQNTPAPGANGAHHTAATAGIAPVDLQVGSCRSCCYPSIPHTEAALPGDTDVASKANGLPPAAAAARGSVASAAAAPVLKSSGVDVGDVEEEEEDSRWVPGPVPRRSLSAPQLKNGMHEDIMAIAGASTGEAAAGAAGVLGDSDEESEGQELIEVGVSPTSGPAPAGAAAAGAATNTAAVSALLPSAVLAAPTAAVIGRGRGGLGSPQATAQPAAAAAQRRQSAAAVLPAAAESRGGSMSAPPAPPSSPHPSFTSSHHRPHTDDRFFFWLDEGLGHNIDLSCQGVPRSKLESERVTYLTAEEREQLEVTVDSGSGLLKYRVTGQYVHTGFHLGVVPLFASAVPGDLGAVESTEAASVEITGRAAAGDGVGEGGGAGAKVGNGFSAEQQQQEARDALQGGEGARVKTVAAAALEAGATIAAGGVRGYEAAAGQDRGAGPPGSLPNQAEAAAAAAAGGMREAPRVEEEHLLQGQQQRQVPQQDSHPGTELEAGSITGNSGLGSKALSRSSSRDRSSADAAGVNGVLTNRQGPVTEAVAGPQPPAVAERAAEAPAAAAVDTSKPAASIPLLTDLLQIKEKPCKWIYVLDTQRRLFVHAKYRGKFHHSSFVEGGAVLAAGGIVVEHGRILKLTADSGHYRPNFESFMATVQMLKDMGADLSQTKLSAKHLRCPQLPEVC